MFRTTTLVSLAALAVAGVLIACQARAQTVDTGGSTGPGATPSPQPWVEDPRPTPVPGEPPACTPAERRAGYPVAFGVDPRFCLAWDDAFDDETKWRVIVDFRRELGTKQPRTAVYDLPAGTTSLTFDPGEGVEFLNRDQRCPVDGAVVSIVATRPSGQVYIGGLEFPASCDYVYATANGCKSPGTRGGVGITFVGTPDGGRTFCAAWFDNWTDETKFVVHLRYPGSGEAFVYEVPADEVDFVIPAADGRRVDIFGEGIGRKDYEIRVVAFRPSGEELAGGHTVIVG